MTKTRQPEPGLTSVIVPCLGRSETIQRCLSAVLRHTRRPIEILAVTRNPNDLTSAYLAGVRDAGRYSVEIVCDPSLKSNRAAWLRGIDVARGDFVALLGPTVMVTDAWLDQLIALVNANTSIGLVGPMSNGMMPPQQVNEVSYADPRAGLEEFATGWRNEHRGRWFLTDSLSGQCLLLKRGVLEAMRSRRKLRVAGLRPNRLALRVKRAGFEVAVANDLYVHQDSKPSKTPNLTSEAEKPTAGSSQPIERRCKVSLTMIVRNEEANLSACLESASGLFDEIVIVDTGSTDRTIEIARSFGARVFEFVWVDDFAAARNAALARATGDYAFWLDADDRIEAPNRELLKSLLDGLRTTDLAYVVRCSCDADPKGGGATVVDHVRLFPVREDVRWIYRVHEQILPGLRRVGINVHWTDVVVRHVGYNDPELRQRKLKRDGAILESELADRPDDPFILFNLGALALEANEPPNALRFLRQSLSLSNPTDSITRKLYALIARSHQLLGESGAALAACSEGLSIDVDDAELWFRKAVLHRHAGDSQKADESWRKILALARPERFSSVDEGIFGHLTRRNLATLAEERGDRAEAALQWSSVLKECPQDTDAKRALDRLSQNHAHR